MSSSTLVAHRPRAEDSPEPYDLLARRNEAAEILQSYEKLSWLSAHRKETLHQTRMHFLNVLAGFTPEDEQTLVYWPTSKEKLPSTSDEAAKTAKASTSKGKERQISTTERTATSSTSTTTSANKSSERPGGTGRNVGSSKKKRKAVGGASSSS